MWLGRGSALRVGGRRGHLSQCGRESIKLPVYRVAFKGFTPTPLHERTYHQEFKDYSEATAELEHQHARAEEPAGRELPAPPLSTLAINKAKGLMARGGAASEDSAARENDGGISKLAIQVTGVPPDG